MGGKCGLTLTGTPPTMDIVVLAGQSNAEGRGDDGTQASPTSNAAHVVYNITTEDIDTPVADPISTGVVGQCMGPALANEWYTRSGNLVMLVEAALGSSTLVPYATSDWGSAGANAYADFVTWTDEAVAKLDLYPNGTLGGIYVIWSQGESEVVNHNGTTITPTIHETDLEQLATDAYTEFNGSYGSDYKGMYAVLMAPRYDDSTHRSMEIQSLVGLTNQYNDAIYNACQDNANITMAHEGSAGLWSVSLFRGGFRTRS
jgi:hypothetical protein